MSMLRRFALPFGLPRARRGPATVSAASVSRSVAPMSGEPSSRSAGSSPGSAAWALDAAGAGAGAAVVRGPLDDVLGRFELAIRDWPGEFVLRATADNPAVDIEAVGRVLQHLGAGADYVVETGLPVGGAVEGVRTDVLRRAAAAAVDPYEREHVTPYVRRRPEEFVVALPSAPAPLRRPDLRLTVDTPADLAFVRRVFGVLRGDVLAPLSRIIDVAESLRGGGGQS